MSKRVFLTTFLFLLFAGVLTRLWVIRRNPIPAGDGIASNILLADNLRMGLGFTTFVKWTLYDPSREFLRPEANRQPAMALLLLPVFAVFGTGITQAQMLALLIGLFTMFSIALWAKRVFGAEVALAVFAYVVFDPPFVWFSTQPDSLMLYTAVFYLIMILADRSEISSGRAVLLGFAAGLLYLIRTQGLLMIPAVGLWVLLRGGKRRWISLALSLIAAFLVVLPWLLRNTAAFGDPFYTQNGQFLLNENHWSAWSVRSTAPSPLDMWNNQGITAVAAAIGAGLYRIVEPFTLGSTHRGELFAQPTVALFLTPAVMMLCNREIRRKMLFPAIAIVPVLLALVFHEHSGRYLSVAVPVVVALGASGLRVLAMRSPGRILLYWVVLVSALIFFEPIAKMMQADSRARAAEAREAAEWIKENTGDSVWVCTYPNVELFHWIYRKPTLAWPNDYEVLLWPYLKNHNVQYLVVDRDLPRMRPWLSRRWRRSPDGRYWDTIDPPPFLTEVWRTESGGTLIYEFTGAVPAGFMAVDSLPPDNYRALAPI